MNEHNLPLLLLATTPKCIYCPPIVNHIWPRLQTKLAGLVIFEHVEVVNYGDPHPYKLDKFIRWYPSFILCDGNIINEYSDRCIVFGGVEINGNVQLARPSKPFTIENIYNWVVDALKNHEFFVSIKDIKLNVEPFDGLDNAIKVALKIQSLLTDYEKVILKYESVYLTMIKET